MSKLKGIGAYKEYWEEQARLMNQSPWNLKMILKLTFSNNLDKNIEEIKFSNHSISRDDGQLILRLKVPYNYSELDNFEVKALELLGIDDSWLININLENSNCTHHPAK